MLTVIKTIKPRISVFFWKVDRLRPHPTVMCKVNMSYTANVTPATVTLINVTLANTRRSAHWIISLAGRSPLRSLLTVTASLASQHSSEHNTHSALTPLACKRGITSYTFKISASLNLAVESGLKSKDVLMDNSSLGLGAKFCSWNLLKASGSGQTP